jgi:hypothetical protein
MLHGKKLESLTKTFSNTTNAGIPPKKLERTIVSQKPYT